MSKKPFSLENARITNVFTDFESTQCGKICGLILLSGNSLYETGDKWTQPGCFKEKLGVFDKKVISPKKEIVNMFKKQQYFDEKSKKAKK